LILRVISDIHSNADALKAVLNDPHPEPPGMTICLGDVVGYGAEPAECIQEVRNSCDIIVAGNHDAGVAGKVPLTRYNDPGAKAIRWTADILTDRDIDWLSSLEYSGIYDGFFLCHSYPPDPESWVYVLSRRQAAIAIESIPDMISLIGHTHLPGCWSIDGNYTESTSGDFSRIRLVNAGSVGQPRDGDPRAAYLLIDTTEGTWEHRRVVYDIDAAASKIRTAGLPEVLWERLYLGR
jgi:diadenosine tetraphosphatase ApaH/serine/threonine PP2A family protein phosphatase